MAKKSLKEKLDELIALLEVETNPVKRAYASAKLESLLARTEKELETRSKVDSEKEIISELKQKWNDDETLELIEEKREYLSQQKTQRMIMEELGTEYDPYSEDFLYIEHLKREKRDGGDIMSLLEKLSKSEKKSVIDDFEKINEYLAALRDYNEIEERLDDVYDQINERNFEINKAEFNLTKIETMGKIGKFFSGIKGFFKGFWNSIRGHKSMMQKEKDGLAEVDEISSKKYSEEYEKRLDEVSQSHQDEISYVNEKSRKRDQAYTKDIADIDAAIAELTKQIEAKRMDRQRLAQEQQNSSHSAERRLDEIRTNISTEVAEKMGGTEEEYIASQQDEFRRRTRVSQDVRDRVNNVTSQMQLHVQDNDGQEQTSSDGQEPGDD